MSAQILPLQAALDARRAKAQRESDEIVERFRMLNPSKKRRFLRAVQDIEARSREKTAGRKNVVDLSA